MGRGRVWERKLKTEGRWECWSRKLTTECSRMFWDSRVKMEGGQEWLRKHMENGWSEFRG